MSRVCMVGSPGAAHYFADIFNVPTVFEDDFDIDKASKSQLKAIVAGFLNEDIQTTVIHENKPLKCDMHPTMKPMPLIAKLIENSSKPDDVVLDLFGGSGTTMMVCEELGRICYMMEYDPVYADVIIQRWETLTGLKAVKL